ncbi:SnoaL-like domain-containing protein, partial [Corallococcus exiguus]|nr:SnoaL-like domain-containing protein [Corallococcus exiguus]
TYVLMQNHEGWRIAHVHSSQAAEERVAASIASVTHSLH